MIGYARQISPAVQVTVLTGVSDEARLQAARQRGPVHLLRKPTDFSQLLDALGLGERGGADFP